jgi:hypothetical protein
MRLKSADQSMITDVSRLRPHRCTIITSIASDTDCAGENASAGPTAIAHRPIVYEHRIGLDASTAEAVEDKARDLASKQLTRRAARKIAAKTAESGQAKKHKPAGKAT